MVIEYDVTPEHVAATYRYLMKNDPATRRVAFAGCALAPAVVLGTAYASEGRLTTLTLILAAICALVGPLLFPFFARWRTKKGRRTVEINPQTLSNRIGSERRVHPWNKIKSVTDIGEYVLITRTNLNVLMIPQVAFQDDRQRHEFVRLCKAYLGDRPAVI